MNSNIMEIAMKKQFFLFALTGLLIGPFARTNAGINNEDLQKMSANTMENKALKNGENFVATLALLAALVTAAGICVTANASPQDFSSSLFFTAASSMVTTGLTLGWYKIFVKRAERHGYKNNLLKFFFVDLMSQETQTQVHVNI